MKKRLMRLAFTFLLFTIVFTACNQKGSSDKYQAPLVSDTAKQNVLVFGFPTSSYNETAEPLVEYLNSHLPGTKIKVHACADWNDYLDLLEKGKFDITLINGILASKAAGHGYSIVGKIASNEPYSSFIITQKNTAIRKVTDLKGKKIAMLPSHIIPSMMMGMYYLYQNGLDVNFNIHKERVASFEAVILSVYQGRSDAGICARRNWNVYVKNHPEILSKVMVKWETPALEHNAILIKNTVDEKVVSDLKNLFFLMHDAKDASKALEGLNINGFEKADSNTYKPMMDFKKKYDSVIF